MFCLYCNKQIVSVPVFNKLICYTCDIEYGLNDDSSSDIDYITIRYKNINITCYLSDGSIYIFHLNHLNFLNIDIHNIISIDMPWYFTTHTLDEIKNACKMYILFS